MLSLLVCVSVAVVAVTTGSLLAAGIGVLLIGFSYAFSPRSYAIEQRSIIVNRLIGKARILLDDPWELRPARGDDLQGCMRLCGSGGLFGYFGLFRTSKLGKCAWYVTNRSNAVVVITGSKTALFSPDDVAGFLAAVRMVAPVPERPAAAWDGSVNSASGRSAPWIGVAVAAVALAVVAFAFLYSPGPPKLTLTANALTIHDRFYPVTLKAGDVDVAHIRVVDIARDAEWRPTVRTNGFANAHYRAGWFRVGNGQRVRLYAASGTRVVLLPPNTTGAAVLLEAPDPEAFVEQIRRDWGRRFQASEGVV